MKASKLQAPIALISCAAVCLSLIGCSSNTQTDSAKTPQAQSPTVNNTQTTKPSATENETTQQSTGNITEDTYNEKINHYMTLVEQLEQEILDIKQDYYIEENQYKATVTELESTVKLLMDRIEAMASGKLITPVDPSDSLESPGYDDLSVINDYQYTVADGGAVITKYLGKSANVTIPSVIDGYTVRIIGESAFQGSDVECVIIPDTVQKIDWFAFSACHSLREITIPASVTNIGYGAFDYCPASMRILCKKGSYAQSFAASWGLIAIAE